jgi:Protein of unknown function (DUF4232)
MKLSFRTTRRIVGGSALVVAAALLPGTALASTAAPAKPAGAAWFARCATSQTLIWLGLGNGGGTAGTIFYPLEFTNISRRTCTLFGFPRAWAVSQNGKQIGQSSRQLNIRHGVVTLPPGATAHAQLGIVEAGNVCSKPVTAANLRVRAPGQGGTTLLPFSFQACHGHKRVLVVGPVQPGVGIP